ncbi:MAG: hypothetical protein ABL962_16825 [Fimbriimonadaceae bacterium]
MEQNLTDAKQQRGTQTLVSYDDTRLLRMIYDLARRQQATKRQRAELVSAIEGRIHALEEQEPSLNGQASIAVFGCAAFGVNSSRELTEIFVQQFEKMVVRLKSFREFRNAIKLEGYRSRVRGKLFHLFVRNFAPLHRDFYEHACRQVVELNATSFALSVRPETEILNILESQGETLPRSIIFGHPLKAQDVCIIKRNGQRVEFVDDIYVAYANAHGVTFWSFLCEMEVKTAGAANGFGRQIGYSHTRMGHDDVCVIELKVEGFKEPVKVQPSHILLSPRTIDRNAISFFGKRSWSFLDEETRLSLAKAIRDGDAEAIYTQSEFRFQTTKVGNGENFRRITLAINAEFFNGYVNAILPTGSEEGQAKKKGPRKV